MFTTFTKIRIKQDDGIILHTIKLNNLTQMILRFNKLELNEIMENILQCTTIKLKHEDADI
jgi:hypothetical protein